MQRDKSKVAAAPFTLRWSAIFGGVFAASGVWLLLHALGLALGFTQLEPSEPSSLRAIGIGSGIWVVLTSMISLFAGGMIVARSAGLLGRSNAALHGIVLWGITTVGGLVLILSLLGTVARGIGNVTAETASYAGSVTSVTQALGLSTRELLSPINQRLQAREMPTITAQQLERAIEDAAQTALARGEFDRELFLNAVARNTALSRTEVRQAFEAAGQRLSNLGQELAAAADRAATMTGRAFWALFATMALSLISALLGAISGVTRRQRELSARAADLASPYGGMPSQPPHAPA